ncbi:MAG: type IV pilus twitching motility protein PilT [Desulfovibrio sp.]|jgi:twitching motility protein PilT|nr:type IV pilus twitching motility protein PilT [Desulfovibrio sp.]
MNALRQAEFSDLILAGDETWFLKGVPGSGPALVAAPPELRGALRKLLERVRGRYAQINSAHSIRLVFEEVAFRAAVYTDVALGDVYFMRRLPETVPSLQALKLPEPVTEWLLRRENSRGLLLFSGAQASGKTTSAGALIAARLEKFGGHAITYEHPVEMPLSGRHGESGFCFQTEIVSEDELASRIERSHRYASPNIVFVGEIRSRHAASEVLRVALGSNQQLVVATIHGLNACAALDRLLTWAREIDGDIARHNLGQSLIGIVHQELSFEKESEDRRARLTVKEFLLLSFDPQSEAVRAKLREGNLHLTEHILEQRNRVFYEQGVRL